MKISKKELQVFLTFFVIYFIFISWIGSNEDSSLDLTRVIVDEGRLEIDNYFNNTVDRSVYNNHYYSNKAIGMPLLAAPIYTSWKFIYYNFFPQSFINSNKPLPDYQTFPAGDKVEIIEQVNPGFLIKLSRILVDEFTSCLFSALTVLLLYKISNFFTKNELHRILLIIIYGLATLAFPYATVFFFHSTSAFFIFLSFYLLFQTKMGEIKRYIIFSGLASGYAFTIDHLTFVINLFLLFYLLTFNRNKKVIIGFLVANLVVISPLLIYNFYIFGTPFDDTFRYSDTAIWYSQAWLLSRNTAGFTLSFQPFIILRLLIFPHLGLFFYYPILILSFYGLVQMNKKYRAEKLLILLSFLLVTILVSMFFYWYSGNFGARFLLIALPFFVIPIVYSLEKIDLKIVLIFLIISVMVNLFSTANWGYIATDAFKKACCEMDADYSNNINTLKIIANPLFEKSIFYFFDVGSRSRLIESFFQESWAFDIRDAWPYIKSMGEPRILNIKLFATPLGFVFMKLSFITTLVLLALIFLIWRKNVIGFISHYKYLFVIIFLLFLLYFFNVGDVAYEKGWYNEEKNNTQTFRWMADVATLDIYSPSPILIKLKVTVGSFFKNRTMEVYLNNRLVSIFQVKNYTQNYTTPFMEFNKGENEIRFVSKEGCDIPSILGIQKGENRCVSFGFTDIRRITPNDVTKSDIVFENNWYPEEEHNKTKHRWMEQNGSTSIFNPKNENDYLKFNFSIWTFFNQTLKMYLNGRLVATYELKSNETKQFRPPLLQLKPGENIIIFNSVEGCRMPSGITELKNETRCLSADFIGMKKLEIKDIYKKIFFENWYPEDQDKLGNFRWMGKEANITYYVTNETTASITFFVNSYHTDRNLNLYVNDKFVKRIIVTTSWNQITINVTLHSRENTITFRSSEGCWIPREVEGLNDTRCLSFAVRGLNIKN
jgi:hypothetical protein